MNEEQTMNKPLIIYDIEMENTWNFIRKYALY